MIQALHNGKLGLAVNPMSGRDVRRLAARATNMTHEAKRDIVARVAAGAEAVGVTDLYITREPFQISSMALEHMGLKARVHVIEHPLANDATDTEQSVKHFIEAGCSTLVSLGGEMVPTVPSPVHVRTSILSRCPQGRIMFFLCWPNRLSRAWLQD